MEYSGDLQNLGGDAHFYTPGPHPVGDDGRPIENYVYPQRAEAFVDFGPDIKKVIGNPDSIERRLGYHSALTKAMVDHMRDVLPAPIIQVGQRAGNHIHTNEWHIKVEYQVASTDTVRVPISRPDGVIMVPVDITKITVPAWKRLTYPDDDFYDYGPSAIVKEEPYVFYSPIEAYLGSAHRQFGGRIIRQGGWGDNAEEITDNYEFIHQVSCPNCAVNLTLIDARLASLKVIKQEFVQNSTLSLVNQVVSQVRINFQLIYELFWVCEDCDVELFGWDPCPEVIWT